MLNLDANVLESIYDELYALIVEPGSPGKGTFTEPQYKDSVLRRVATIKPYFTAWRESIVEQEREGKPKMYAFDNLPAHLKKKHRQVEWWLLLLEGYLCNAS